MLRCIESFVQNNNTVKNVPVLGQSPNLLSGILTILLKYTNSDTLLCCSSDPFLTVNELLRTQTYDDCIFN